MTDNAALFPLNSFHQLSKRVWLRQIHHRHCPILTHGHPVARPPTLRPPTLEPLFLSSDLAAFDCYAALLTPSYTNLSSNHEKVIKPNTTEPIQHGVCAGRDSDKALFYAAP